MCQADSHCSVAPCCHGCGCTLLTQGTPVLLLLIKESVLVGKCFLRQLVIAFISRGAGKMGQGPADPGHSMGKAAYAFRQIFIRPVNVSVLMLSALLQQVSQL